MTNIGEAAVQNAIAVQDARQTMITAFTSIIILVVLLLFVDQIRRLIQFAILNRTIRKAIDADASVTPLLVGKLEVRRPWPRALAGWLLVATSVTLGIAAALEEPGMRVQTIECAVIMAGIGITILLYARFSPKPSSGDDQNGAGS